ncbi:MAG: cobyric acid synthase CobQ [Dehalococcoidia bacterium]|nr:cobyric acid synthase CobQ [Dehalococcoidia bacterium]
MELLEADERALVKGFVINKFRGDATLLDPGLEFLEKRTGVATLGVLPYFTDIHIPEEDSLGLPTESSHRDAVLDIAVMKLPHIANFDDFDPLRRHPGVNIRFVPDLPGFGNPDLVVIPGSKTTIADLAWMRQHGLDEAVLRHRHAGKPIIGICAGYQILGERLIDPEGTEGPAGETPGLGLLPVTTVFKAPKTTTQTEARVLRGEGLLARCLGEMIRGYEIHMGQTAFVDSAVAPFGITCRSGIQTDGVDGATSPDGRVLGTYLHGLFHNRGIRRGILDQLAEWKGARLPPEADFDQYREYDRLADFVEQHLDLDRFCCAVGLQGLWPEKPR